MPKKMAVATAHKTKMPPPSLPNSHLRRGPKNGRCLGGVAVGVLMGGGGLSVAYLASQASKKVGLATAVVAPTFLSLSEYRKWFCWLYRGSK